MVFALFSLRVRGLPWWVQLALGLMVGFCLLSLVLVTIADPGVIPPKKTVGRFTGLHMEQTETALLPDDNHNVDLHYVTIGFYIRTRLAICCIVYL